MICLIISHLTFSVGFTTRPSGVGSEPDDTLYETDDLDQVSVSFVLEKNPRYIETIFRQMKPFLIFTTI